MDRFDELLAHQQLAGNELNRRFRLIATATRASPARTSDGWQTACSHAAACASATTTCHSLSHESSD